MAAPSRAWLPSKTLYSIATGLTCGDSEPGLMTDVLPGRVGCNTAVGTLILLGHLQNLEHPVRKGNEPAAYRAKQRRGGRGRKREKELNKWLSAL